MTQAAATTRSARSPRKPSPKAGGSLRDDLKRFTRDKIVAAALESFAQTGFRETSVERIVDLAGTTAPTFYRHFSSNNDLIAPLQERVKAEVSAVIDRLDTIEQADFATIRSWLNEFAAMWERMHRLCAAYWEATDADPKTAANIVPSALITVSRLQGLLGRCPPARRRSAELRLALMIPLLDRAILVSKSSRDPDLEDELLNEFALMLVAALDGLFKPAGARGAKAKRS
jgi:AcrR family transcriptional regulator